MWEQADGSQAYAIVKRAVSLHSLVDESLVLDMGCFDKSVAQWKSDDFTHLVYVCRWKIKNLKSLPYRFDNARTCVGYCAVKIKNNCFHSFLPCKITKIMRAVQLFIVFCYKKLGMRILVVNEPHS